MQRITGPILILALILLAAPSQAQDTDAAADASPWPVDLSGVWNLDEKNSDDLAAQIEAMREKSMASRGGRGGGMGGRGGGMGGRGGGMGGMGGRGGGGSEGGEPGQAPGADLAQAMQQLLISRFEDSMEIVDGVETARLWTPDGKTYRTRTLRGEATTRAWWDEGELVLESKGARHTVTQRLRLVGDKTLEVQHTMEMGRAGTVKATLVYQGA